MQNYINQFPSKEHLYRATRAYRREVHEHHRFNFIGIDNVALWFKQNYSLLWYKSGFNPDIKCNYVTNNIA
jgi:lipid II:glycine glycyltransferase (peptidoglycan interpeptide bridge formation enzyme)